MSWRIVVTDSSALDFSQLDETDRLAVNEDLVAWVEDGPPRRPARRLGEADMFEELLPSGFRLAYFVNDFES